jgi:hypothetical protein
VFPLLPVSSESILLYGMAYILEFFGYLFHSKSYVDPCLHGIVCPLVAVGGDGLQI